MAENKVGNEKLFAAVMALKESVDRLGIQLRALRAAFDEREKNEKKE